MSETIRESEYGESPNNYHIRRFGDAVSVELTYPPYTDNDNEREPRKVRYVEVNQESVRASDGVRLYYDYDRDGWGCATGEHVSVGRRRSGLRSRLAGSRILPIVGA